MSERPPVKDWATDFDHLHPQWIADPFPIWDELRKTCPIAHTDRFMGVYLPTRYEDVRAVAYDTEHFSSRRVVVRETPPPRVPAPPITSDPPEHRPARMVLLPPFTPDAMKKIEPRARAIANELIDKFIARGSCDAAVEYAQEIPVRVIAHMLGLPEGDGDLYRKWIHQILEVGITDQSALMQAVGEMTHYFMGHVHDRSEKPRDDLISYLLNAKFNGQPMGEEYAVGALRLLLIAGIDTTWSGIGSCLWHLAKTPADRRRLVAEPSLMPTAIEEFLRAFAPVTMAREVVKETQINGCTFKPGQMVMLSFPAANRDPADVRRRRQGDHRPQGEPPRRLRAGHPPLRRLQPRPSRDDGGGRGAPQAHPRVHPRRRRHLVRRHGPRPAQAADPVRVTCHSASRG